MNRILLLYLLAFSTISAGAQQFRGQWKGYFSDRSTSFQGWGGNECEYVLEIETEGSQVSGYSYTYFTQGGKRYYTICKLTGHINKAKKYIEVKETERTKTNVPVTIRNCFQVHKLYYEKSEGSEIISGDWIPAPQQQGDCGYGYTFLERRLLKTMVPGFNRGAEPGNVAKKPARLNPVAKAPVKKEPPVVKAQVTPGKTDQSPERPPLAVNKELKQVTEDKKEERKKPELITPLTSFKNRDLEVLKTIKINSSVITVNVYDNAEVDGDSISLYYNGKLILKNKRLCEKGHSLELAIDTERVSNELIMHAENLGTIPPNTALMVVRDGMKRYEVRISSDLRKSGVIRFVYAGEDHASAGDKQK